MNYGTTTAIAGGLSGIANGMDLGMRMRSMKNTEEERKRMEEERRLERERRDRLDQHALDREGLADKRQKKLDALSEEEHGWKKTEFQQKQKAAVMAGAFNELAANKQLSPDTVAQIKKFDSTFEKAEMTYGVDAAGMTVHVTRKEYVPDPKNPNAAPAVKYNTQSIPALAAKKWFEGVLGNTKSEPRLYPTGKGGYAAWDEENGGLQQVREPDPESADAKTPVQRDPVADDASKSMNAARVALAKAASLARSSKAELQKAIGNGADKNIIADKQARHDLAIQGLDAARSEYAAWQQAGGLSGPASAPQAQVAPAPQYGAGLEVGGGQQQIPQIGTMEEFAQLPAGATYIDTRDGKRYQKQQ